MRLPIAIAAGLIVFIIAGFASQVMLAGSAREMTRHIEQAERALESEQTDAALAALEKLKSKWRQAEKYWGMVTEHSEMDEINLTLDRTMRFLSVPVRRTAEAQAELGSLRFLINHIPEKESLTLQSLL